MCVCGGYDFNYLASTSTLDKQKKRWITANEYDELERDNDQTIMRCHPMYDVLVAYDS